jgi:colanic acid biosynthesis glycosyl transferase WcaI
MKILVHDFVGHPFQFQLSRELSRRGHEVMHAYFADFQGPKGKLNDREDTTLVIEPLHVSGSFKKYSYLQRLKTHRDYVQVLKEKIAVFQPEVVISGNMPTEAQYFLGSYCKSNQIRFVHWIQDFYALALQTFLTRKVGAPIGRLCAMPFHLLERRIFKMCDAVVYISDDFPKHAQNENYTTRTSVVIENWASLEELPARPKDNEWSRREGLADKFVFLYSGTMGLKHNPGNLADLARKFKDNPRVRVVLVSEGIGRSVLEEIKRNEQLDNLLLFDFQPYSTLPDVMGAADVLLASVEADSSVFCVPSKILSYMCAGRPMLISLPAQNLAARVVKRADAGYICDPGDDAAFLSYAEALYSDNEACVRMGVNARQYAEATFDIKHISGVFESVLRDEKCEAPMVASPVTMRAPS